MVGANVTGEEEIMKKRLLTLAVLTSALLAAPAALGADNTPPMPPSASAQANARPNIVMFFLDDTNPHDGRLWSDPSITPNLYDMFVAHGVQFANAIGETPLCCPGRAGVLTGLHTFNHGVTYNDARLFDSSEHVGKELKAAGYETSLIGKYFNHSDRLTPEQWAAAADGWTNLDVFRTAPDPVSHYYYNYTLFTKEGDVAYTDQHSTQTIAERAVARLQASSPDAPVFTMLSIFDTHGPNMPMNQFIGDSRCADMQPWDPPNYNEGDVSDKPAYVQSLPLLARTDGWPMVTMCEEMLGVDWLVGQVRDELQAEGRLANTLFVFAADNGMAWGQHRIGQEKQVPYATPIPLYMSWPSRWGDSPRTIDDAVSNIDLAPTFCAVGGCSMGPYASGQTGPDGISLLPLLDGDVEHLARDAVLEENFQKHPFAAVRTSPNNPLGHWHYVLYKSGFIELYNLETDAWELNNLRSDPTLDEVRSQLSSRLTALLAEGRIAPVIERPDSSVATVAAGIYKGLNRYSTVPTSGQTQKVTGLPMFTVVDFSARVTNHGTAAVTYALSAVSSGNARIKVTYYANGLDVTSDVVAGTYSLTDVQPHASVDLLVRMTIGKARLSAKRNAVLTYSLGEDTLQTDVIKAVAVRSTTATPPPP
jgi:N-acetylglucosamine-6-sulfatase